MTSERLKEGTESTSFLKQFCYKNNLWKQRKDAEKVDEICYNLHKNLFLLVKEEVRRWSDGQRNSRNDARD